MNHRYIVFEGCDGSGKSTQAEILANRLGARITREPGGTQVGKIIRETLLKADLDDHGRLRPETEALLMAADRTEHIATVVRPAMEAGEYVVSDRSLYSSLAYQGYGSGVDLDFLGSINEVATGGTLPDLVFFIDLDPKVALERASGGDRFEDLQSSFHRRVYEGYQQLAAADPDRWVVVDGSGSVEEVAARVSGAFETQDVVIDLTEAQDERRARRHLRSVDLSGNDDGPDAFVIDLTVGADAEPDEPRDPQPA